MYSKGNKHLLAIVACIIIATSSLVGCDFECDCNIFFENKTSDTIIISHVDSSRYSLNTPLTIAPGETKAVVEMCFFDAVPHSSDIPEIMRKSFPGGLTITTQEGKTRFYSPDSIKIQSFSPFAEKSYRYEYPDGPMGKHNLHAFYEIKDTIMQI